MTLMTDTTAMIYSPDFARYDLGAHHPLHQERVRLHYELCKALGLLKQPGVVEPKFKPATEQQLRLVHTQAYLDQVRELSQREGYSLLDAGDTPAFPGAYDVTSLIVGGTLAGADAVMTGKAQHAWNPGGGFHHAHPDHASGFCIFNDVAIACRYLQSRYKVKRILYLDIDVHHADGVQDVFYNDSGVLTLSFHESGDFLFPGTGFQEELGEGEGRGYAVNLPLPPYTLDEHYLRAFEAIVPPVVQAYRPEVIVMQNGVDAHYQDELGHLALTTRAYAEVAARAHHLAHEYAQGRLIAVGGGGYSYLSVPRCWTLIFGQFAGLDVEDRIPEEWQRLFRQVTGLQPPSHVRDHDAPQPAQSSRERVGRLVEQSVSRLQQLAFPLLGIEKPYPP
jgi:acetoin utilization protein AcuC